MSKIPYGDLSPPSIIMSFGNLWSIFSDLLMIISEIFFGKFDEVYNSLQSHQINKCLCFIKLTQKYKLYLWFFARRNESTFSRLKNRMGSKILRIIGYH